MSPLWSARSISIWTATSRTMTLTSMQMSNLWKLNKSTSSTKLMISKSNRSPNLSVYLIKNKKRSKKLKEKDKESLMRLLMMMSLTMRRKMSMEENASTLGSSCRKESVTLARLSSLNHLLVVNTVLKSLHTTLLKQYSITKTITSTWKLRDQFKK